MTDRSDSESPEEAPQKPASGKHEALGGPAEGINQDAVSQDQQMSSGFDALADDSRSGADVREAVNVAEAGTSAEGDHAHPERAKSGEAPVEQVYNDPAMTEGQRTGTGAATSAAGAAPGPSPAEAGSGGAQSVVGARESDRRAAGEPPAAGPPFETGESGQQAKQQGHSE
ncbi:hypothetical protein [Arthrobacter sp. B3I4]|uniref:hypothetical protein n=1 Tax=Arthrobacter sp. B3I4 TaxID=3042267 RepID=UPI00278AA872|nr:hypothetical protein [Arthrobacter sp. B3I4]MDQ0755039.1 hypothetical protein [Arthrobacter sp. B3I4]